MTDQTPDPDLAALLAAHAVTADGVPFAPPRGTAAGDLAWCVAEVQALRQQVAGHVERIAKQSDLLGKRAERQPCAECARLRDALAAAATSLYVAARALPEPWLRKAEQAARAALESPP